MISLGEIYGIMVSSGISPGYFLDQMSFDEIAEIFNQIDKIRQEKWEQIRQLAYYSVLPHTKKIKKPSDLFRLPWDSKPKKAEVIKKLSSDELEKKLQKINKNTLKK